jgi:hypothetical protein
LFRDVSETWPRHGEFSVFLEQHSGNGR